MELHNHDVRVCAQQLYAIFAQDLVSLHNCTADIATLQFMDLASRYVAIRPTQNLWWQSHMTWHACLSLATVAIEESAMDEGSTTEPR